MDIFGVNAEELGAISDEDEGDEYDEDEEDLDNDDEDLIEDEENEDEGMNEDDDEPTRNYTKKRQRQRRLKALHKIEDIFEPQELEKGLITELDQQIRLEDKPERFMLRPVPITQADEEELEKEAEWIYSQAFAQKLVISNQDYSKSSKSHLVVPKIKDTLNFIRNEFLEVPFIASYRKEYINPDLDSDDLWKIYEMDQKYCQLKARKENLVKLFQRMQKYQFEQMRVLTQRDEENPDEVSEEDEQAKLRLLEMIRTLDDKDIDRVRNAQTVEEILDCHHHFHLHYGNDLIPLKEFEAKMEKVARKTMKKKIKKFDENGDEIENDEENEDEENDNDEEDIDDSVPKFTKFASKKDVYHHCKMSGLNSFAKKFGLTPEQYGENLQADYQKHEIDQWAVEPSMVATDFMRDTNFNTVDQVLTTVRYMVSIQLAKDPTVRQYVRDLYMQRACINVKPTMPKGNYIFVSIAPFFWVFDQKFLF
jgi:transcription elongation factor SPT6